MWRVLFSDIPSGLSWALTPTSFLKYRILYGSTAAIQLGRRLFGSGQTGGGFGCGQTGGRNTLSATTLRDERVHRLQDQPWWWVDDADSTGVDANQASRMSSTSTTMRTDTQNPCYAWQSVAERQWSKPFERQGSEDLLLWSGQTVAYDEVDEARYLECSKGIESIHDGCNSGAHVHDATRDEILRWDSQPWISLEANGILGWWSGIWVHYQWAFWFRLSKRSVAQAQCE
jgi:hypothetical protein